MPGVPGIYRNAMQTNFKVYDRKIDPDTEITLTAGATQAFVYRYYGCSGTRR